MSRTSGYNNKIEIPIVIFSVNQGNLRVLLFKNENEPYKGYWKLPTDILESNQNINEKPLQIIREKTGISNAVINQANVYYDMSTILNENVVHISYLALANTVDVLYKREKVEGSENDWFDADKLPKICFNHQQIIDNALTMLRDKLSVSNEMKALFPNDFTLPEIQKVCEQILKKEFDRRNFRKKIITLLEDTGEKYIGKNGRPAKLYRFKEEEEKLLFN